MRCWRGYSCCCCGGGGGSLLGFCFIFIVNLVLMFLSSRSDLEYALGCLVEVSHLLVLILLLVLIADNLILRFSVLYTVFVIDLILC